MRMYEIELPKNTIEWIESNIFGKYNRHWLSQQPDMLTVWANCKDPALLVQMIKKTNQLTTGLCLDIHALAIETPLFDGKKVYNLIEDEFHIQIVNEIRSKHYRNSIFYKTNETRIVQNTIARYEGNDSPLLHAMWAVTSQFLGLYHAASCALSYAHKKGVHDMSIEKQAQVWQSDKIRALITTT